MLPKLEAETFITVM